MLALVGVVAEASSEPCQQLPTVFFMLGTSGIRVEQGRVRQACWRVASVLCEWGGSPSTPSSTSPERVTVWTDIDRQGSE